MTSITIDGKKWSVPDVDAIVRGYNALEPAKRPRFLLGCERCKRICTRWGVCKCCAVYKTKSGGGAAVYYPDDDKGHLCLIPAQQFVDKIGELRGAA